MRKEEIIQNHDLNYDSSKKEERFKLTQGNIKKIQKRWEYQIEEKIKNKKNSKFKIETEASKSSSKNLKLNQNIKKKLTLLLFALKSTFQTLTIRNPLTFHPVTIGRTETSAGTLINFQRFSTKIPSSTKKYISFRYFNNPTYITLEIIDLETEGNYKTISLTKQLTMYNVEFYERELGNDKCIIHYNDPDDSKDKISYTSLITSDPKFDLGSAETYVVNESFKLDNRRKKSSFVYIRHSDYFLMTSLTAADKYKVSVRNFRDNVHNYEATASDFVGVAYFMEDQLSHCNTRFAVLDFKNSDKTLRYFTYDDRNLTPVSTLNREALGLPNTYSEAIGTGSRYTEFAAPLKGSNILAMVSYSGQNSDFKFIDIDLKTKNIRSKVLYVYNEAEGCKSQFFYGFKDTGYYLSNVRFGESGLKLTLINNHNGESDIEFISLPKTKIGTSQTYDHGGEYYNPHFIDETGEVLVEGLLATSLTRIIHLYQLITELECHTYCEKDTCKLALLKSKCVNCRDPANMDSTAGNDKTCACKSTHPEFSRKDKFCVASCVNYQISEEGMNKCLTQDECEKALHFYPRLSTQKCLNWKTCAEKGAPVCFDPVNCKCIEGINTDVGLTLTYSSMNFCVNPHYCINIKRWKVAGTECLKECPPPLPYETPDGNYCFNADTCRAYTGTGSEVYIPDDNTTPKSCDKKTVCEAENTKIVYVATGEKKSCILKTACDTSKKIIKAEGVCRDACNIGNEYLNPDSNTCHSETTCKDVPKVLANSPTVPKKRCYDETECKADSDFRWNLNDFTCIPVGDCPLTVSSDPAGTCRNNCLDGDFLNPASKTCYSSKNCIGASKKTVEGGGKKLCLDETECKSQENFYWNTELETCLHKDNCKFFVNGGTAGVCYESCPSGKEFVNPGTRTCYDDSCGGTLLKFDFSGKKHCFSDEECKTTKIGEYLLKISKSKKDCIPKEKCAEEEWVESNKECLEKCPKNEFKQQGEYFCVSENDCEGKKGNPQTGNCYKEEKPVQAGEETEDYTIDQDDKGNLIAKPKINARLSRKGKEQVKLKLSILKVSQELLQKVLQKVVVNIEKALPDFNQILGRRILQQKLGDREIAINEFEIEKTPNEIDKYDLYIDSPSDKNFKATLIFDTENEYEITENGKKKRVKFAIKTLTYDVGPVEKRNSDGTFLGYFTMVFDVYLRMVAPFVPPKANTFLNIQAFMSQNYQRIFIFSRLNFWKKGNPDLIYQWTFRDWFGEFSKILVGKKIRGDEIERECSKNRERFCEFEMNRNFLVTGLGELILLIIYFGISFGVILNFREEVVDLNNPNNKKKWVIFFRNKFIPYALLVAQTNLIFYSVSTIIQAFFSRFFFTFSFILSLLFILAIFVILALFLKKGSFLHNYYFSVYDTAFSQLFNPETGINTLVFLLSGLIYDLTLALIISIFPNNMIFQAIVLTIVEISYSAIILKKSPFKNPKVKIMVLVNRAIMIFQCLVALVLSFIKEETNFTNSFEIILYICSWLQILISIGSILFLWLKPREITKITPKKLYIRPRGKKEGEEEIPGSSQFPVQTNMMSLPDEEKSRSKKDMSMKNLSKGERSKIQQDNEGDDIEFQEISFEDDDENGPSKEELETSRKGRVKTVIGPIEDKLVKKNVNNDFELAKDLNEVIQDIGVKFEKEANNENIEENNQKKLEETNGENTEKGNDENKNIQENDDQVKNEDDKEMKKGDSNNDLDELIEEMGIDEKGGDNVDKKDEAKEETPDLEKNEDKEDNAEKWNFEL